MISSWLNFTVCASIDPFRVHHAQNAGKYHPLLQCLPYRDITSVGNKLLRLVQYPSSRLSQSDRQNDRPTWDWEDEGVWLSQMFPVQRG
jgi:hypothetical protein